MNLDIVNGCFETYGALSIFRSCWMTWKAKQTVGISAAQVAGFGAWGYFNCFYYPNLNQWFSFSAGVLVAIANTIWLSQIIYYRKKSLELKDVDLGT